MARARQINGKGGSHKKNQEEELQVQKGDNAKNKYTNAQKKKKAHEKEDTKDDRMKAGKDDKDNIRRKRKVTRMRRIRMRAIKTSSIQHLKSHLGDALRSGYLPKFHEMLRLPRKVALHVHQILRLPQNFQLKTSAENP